MALEVASRKVPFWFKEKAPTGEPGKRLSDENARQVTLLGRYLFTRSLTCLKHKNRPASDEPHTVGNKRHLQLEGPNESGICQCLSTRMRWRILMSVCGS